MEQVTDLNALHSAFVNLEYTLPGGQAVKFWDDDKIILGNQLHKRDSDRCYGIAADEKYLLVCEYGCQCVTSRDGVNCVQSSFSTLQSGAILPTQNSCLQSPDTFSNTLSAIIKCVTHDAISILPK